MVAARPESKSFLQEFRGLARLWPHLRDQKRVLIVACLMIPVIAGLEASLPLLLRYGVDEGMLSKDMGTLTLAAVLFMGAVIAAYLARGVQGMTSALAVHRMIRSLRDRVIRHVMALKVAYHDKSMSGALVTRATSDFDSLSDSLNMGVLTSVVDISVLAGTVIGMFYLNWKLALSTLVILPVVMWIVRAFSVALKSAMLKARRKIAALNAFAQEGLYGNSTIKLLAAERAASEKFDVLNREYRDAQMSSVILDAWMFSVLDGIASVTVGIVLWFAVSRLAPGMVDDAGKALSAGILVGFVQAIQQLFEPLKHLGNKIAMLQGAFTSIDRVFGVLDRKEFISGNVTAPPLRGAVSFENVTFSYGPDKPVLENLSFSIEAGQAIAIVGPTGSGKSTLIKLLSKMYDGYEGTIRLDGMDLADLDPVSLRRRMAIVPQDIMLFDGTIGFNIGLDLPGVDAAAIRRAAQAVGADAFIEALPGAYDFPIREQGGGLSHGQKQLIAFARALVREPGIVILDEATSSVDPESERLVQRAISRMLKGRTVIVIAHRLSTVRQCDKILVLEKGRLLEEGSHDELLARRGAYYRLHSALAD